MRGVEERVEAAYVNWLDGQSWIVRREGDIVEVYGESEADKLYDEGNGRTAAIGLDVDTLYGQLLRRMKDPGTSAQYAVVVPTAALVAALRVPAWVRDRLHIGVYEVDDDGTVHPHS